MGVWLPQRPLATRVQRNLHHLLALRAPRQRTRVEGRMVVYVLHNGMEGFLGQPRGEDGSRALWSGG